MQKIFHLILIAVYSIIAQAITTTATTTCSPSEGETGSDNYAVLKRNCYSKYGQPYSPKFYPLTKRTLYKTSQATTTCGTALSIMFHGNEVCVSYTYQEYEWTKRGIELSLSRCERRCFSESATILKRKNFPTYSYQADREIKSDLDLIITPKQYNIQPIAEPCYPTTGEAGSLDVAVLKRVWCQSYTKKICFTVSYPLLKGVSFMTSQANRTYGRDVSVIFYGKEVCIAYMYERFSYSNTYQRSILDTSYCKKTCFTGYKSNQQEKRKGPANPFNPALEWESDYELIVASGNTGLAKWKFNFTIVMFSILISMLV